MRKGLFALALTALLIGAVGHYIFSTGTGTSEGTGTEGHGEETQLESIKTPYPYTVVDTGQEKCYDTSGKEIACPEPGEPLYGQDAQYEGYQPKYRDNGDGTVTDLNTGLMWTRSPDWNGDGEINYEDKMTYEEALEFVKKLNEEKYLGYDDWRLPSIKELYSLIVFSGVDPSGYDGADTSKLVPFIDTNYFEFAYGDTKAGERIIDAQFLSSTRYVGKVMRGQEAVFGVNFADGRIKAYPITKKFYVLFVRGNPEYGKNDFVDNGDGTITDRATGLMWTKNDSGYCMDWEEALEYVQRMNEENYLGYSDWRLPNAKELQSIVDYTRAPDAVNPAQRGPAIDPIFNVTPIVNEGGELDYPYYWTSTTHVSMFGGGRNAVYIAFGRALGWMNTPQGYKLMDVHGAGAQRSDPKTGDPSRYPYGHGPQGDVVRICAFVRLVRDANVTPASNESSSPGVDYQGLGGKNNTGVVLKSENATEGYILFSPLSSKKTYLINYDGAVIHSWATQYFPGQNAYLLENGHLLRTGKVEDSPFSKAGGAGGVVQEFNWEGNLLWEFRYCSENYCTHHDIEPLPNGNILMIVWDKKSRAEAIENGMNPELVPEEGIWSECIIEVKPEGKEGGEIVWKWCAWDHLIQEYDPSKPNYGDVEEHPERINLNYKVGNPKDPDWLHINSVDYNPELDLILLTVHNFNEIWVIDHSTTTEEAASHEGGKYGKGGDLLYRWGNPKAYGEDGDTVLFGPHAAQWIPEGYPGEGNILIFNNGQGRPDGRFSSVLEVDVPEDAFGKSPTQDAEVIWNYRSQYYADRISGAERLPSGNTLICYGPLGRFEEVAPDGKVVWAYVNPFGKTSPDGTFRNAIFTVHWYPEDFLSG